MPASIEEIRQEETHMQLCTCCQETVERMNQKRLAICSAVVIPKSCDRINRVLKFMDNFLVSKEVQIVALDAVISFARNADAPRSINETNLIAVAHSSVKLHAEVPEVVWRVAMAYSLVAAFSGDVAYQVAKTGAHLLIISKYAHYQKKKDNQVLQQILWMMGALLHWPASRVILNRQSECMDFYKAVIQDFEDLKLQIANDPASKKKVS